MKTDSAQIIETPEQIAHRIRMSLRGRVIPPEREDELESTILLALRGRDERAAQICERGAMMASPVGVIPASDPEHERLQRLTNVLISAAQAIRGGTMKPTNHDITAALDVIEASKRSAEHPRTIARERVKQWRSSAEREQLPISNPHDDKGAPVLDVDSTLKWEGHIGRK